MRRSSRLLHRRVRTLIVCAWAFPAIACRAGDGTPSARERPAGEGATSTAASGTRVDLSGAGATFPYPLYARWFNEYATRSNVRINYLSIGSEEGVDSLRARGADFGATDVQLSAAQRDALGTRVLHVPTTLGAVAIIYNLPSIDRQLRFDGATLADIFLGRIARWNDPRIASLNPGIALPDLAITVTHREDGSGTSYIMSEYLGAVSSAWRAGPGREPARRVAWPVGVGANGSEGLASTVRQTEGAIGYVEVVYARQNRLSIARVRNRAGQFVTPMAYEISAAAIPTGDGTSVDAEPRSLVDGSARDAYPITAFTWILLPPDRLGAAKTRQLVGFLKWALTDGGDMASALGYVPLPTAVADRVIAALDSLSGAAPP